MQRRAFIRNTALCAVAVSTCGFIRFDGERYVGDCESTTDILGPFYRPGSPVRNNLQIKGDQGIPVELRGTIFHSDCKTPFNRAKIELWHCSPSAEYDNTSDQYRYRGTVFTDSKGKYGFQTILPVPYDAGGFTRPAHFHLMISAEGYQPFVTQLYFSGDKHIAKDPYASSSRAKKRILAVSNTSNGAKKVTYDVSLGTRLTAEPAVIDRLAGVYRDEKDANRRMEFFKKDDLLWLKNEVFGQSYEYIGENAFQYPGLSQPMSQVLRFELLTGGGARVTRTVVDENGKTRVNVALKEL
jgi:catechol 1,2-dioxygenase